MSVCRTAETETKPSNLRVTRYTITAPKGVPSEVHIHEIYDALMVVPVKSIDIDIEKGIDKNHYNCSTIIAGDIQTLAHLATTLRPEYVVLKDNIIRLLLFGVENPSYCIEAPIPRSPYVASYTIEKLPESLGAKKTLQLREVSKSNNHQQPTQNNANLQTLNDPLITHYIVSS
jgi:hypothetical protein